MDNFLTEDDRERIKHAIHTADKQTGGEIRVYVEKICKGDALKRAQKIFTQLKMQNTELRCGVLFYVAHESRQFAIAGDSGIHEKVKQEFWDSVKDLMIPYFKENKYAEGLEKGIAMAGEQLKIHFPYSGNDTNELSDDVVEGK